MKTEVATLWEKIQAFRLDEAAVSFPFSRRLMRENGWDEAYTYRVMEEYKKFLLLMCVAGHPVTPSDEVDQVWHLHLLYTRSYWEDLCENTLGQRLHHGPTRGGQAEGNKFNDWYARTLQSYRAIFGTEPPVDIWRPAKIRFGEIHFRRVNMHRNWVITKPLYSKWSLSLVPLLVIPFLLLGEIDVATAIGMGIFLIGSLLMIIIVWSVKKKPHRQLQKKKTASLKNKKRNNHNSSSSTTTIIGGGGDGGSDSSGNSSSADSFGGGDFGGAGSSGDSGCGGSGCSGGGCGGGGCGGCGG